jgi:hypothetical protein
MVKSTQTQSKRQGACLVLMSRPGQGWGWYLRGERLDRDAAARALNAKVSEVRHG